MSGFKLTWAAIALGALGSVAISDAGMNWKAVWIEPANPVILQPGQTQPYTIVGLSGADTKADLTFNSHLKIVSLDPAVVEVDQQNARLTGKRNGAAEIKISFSEAVSLVNVYVRDREPLSQPRPEKRASSVQAGRHSDRLLPNPEPRSHSHQIRQ